MRISKSPEERKKEIIITAQKLFNEKGYDNTKIIDITNYMNVAKGTFYYYFKSKEDVIESIVEMTLNQIIDSAKQLAEMKEMKAIDKIRLLFFGDTISNDEIEQTAKHFDVPSNRALQERTMVETVKRLSPIVADIIDQGVIEGDFEVDNTLEKVEFILSGAQFLLDSGLFHWNNSEKKKRTEVLLDIFTKVFGMKKGLS